MKTYSKMGGKLHFPFELILIYLCSFAGMVTNKLAS